jgi:hypothetical protein
LVGSQNDIAIFGVEGAELNLGSVSFRRRKSEKSDCWRCPAQGGRSAGVELQSITEIVQANGMGLAHKIATTWLWRP